MTTPVSTWQAVLLVILRVALGWHLFLQGYGKLISRTWTAKGYLEAASGPFANAFHAMAANAHWLGVADRATVWALMVLGLLLMIGLFSRAGALGGAALLLAFYLAAAPVPSGLLVPTVDGTERYVNKLLIEVMALLVVAAFHTGRMAGLDVLWTRNR